MNSPFMIRMSQHLAGRAAAAEPQLARQIAFAGRAVFGRDLTAAEAAPFETYAAKHGLASLCRLLFNTNEFLFAD